MPEKPLEIIRDPRRVAAVRETGLLDTGAEEAFDRFTALVREVLDVPVALVTLLDEDRQFFKAHAGLPEPWASRQEAPLTHTFCRYVVARGEPFLLEDAADHPAGKGSPAVDEMGVRAYAGVPLTDAAGNALGALAAIDTRSRRWGDHEVALLQALAQAVGAQMGASRGGDLAGDELRVDYRRLVDALPVGIVVHQDGEILVANPEAARLVGVEAPEVLAGRSLLEFMPEEIRGDVRREIEQVQEEGRPTPLTEYPVTRPDGEQAWVEAKAIPVTFAGRAAVQVMVRDIGGRKQALEELRAAERRQRVLLEHLPAIVWTVDRDLRFTSSAGRGLEQLGLGAEEVVGTSLPEYFDTDDPDFLAIRKHRRTLEEGVSLDYEVEWSGRTWRSYIEPLYREEEGVVGVVGVAFDVTGQREAQEELERSERRYRSLFEESRDAIYMTGPDGQILEANPAMEELFGYRRGELLSLRWEDLFAAAGDHRRLASQLGDRGSVEDFDTRARRADGSSFPCLLTATARTGEEGGEGGHQGILRDITDRKRFEEQLEHQALHDQLTGLPNRALFWDRLDHALARARREGSPLAVLFMDLDRFKVVNDSLGHTAGDEVLMGVARRVRGVFREEDTVARFGGDEFTVLLEDVVGPEDARAAAERLLAALEAPFRAHGEEVHMTASVGVSLLEPSEPGRHLDRDELVRRADVAMYRAKNAPGSSVQRFDPEVDREGTRSLRRESELRQAIEEGQFMLHYQPIVSLPDRDTLAVEPLARWRHPERGLLPPDQFIPLAEETGLILPLGQSLLRRALDDLAGAAGPPGKDLRVHVNLSARQFEDPGLEESVRELLANSPLDPGRITLEVTEGVVMRAPERVNAIRGLGVSVAVDDFGTGYSSLSYLKRLRVDALKIDMSFVQGLGRDPRDEAIVRAIVMLGRTLGLQVIAEGVEKEEQLRVLRQMDCRLAQGFYFSRPVAWEVLERRLAGDGAD